MIQPSVGHWLVKSFGFLCILLKLSKCLMPDEKFFGVCHSYVINHMAPFAYVQMPKAPVSNNKNVNINTS